MDNNSLNMLSTFVSVRNPFGFSTKYASNGEFITNKVDLIDPIKIYASKGKIGYVENDSIKKK